MEIALKIVLVLHFVGLAMIVGGALHQVKEKAKNVTRTMLDGAYAQILTGVILVGLLYANDEGDEIDNGKIGVKFGVAVVIAIVGFANRKKLTNNVPAWATMLGLAIVNIAVAVFWH